LHGENEHDGKRHVAWETMCDYGARAGFWRLHRLFTRRKLPVTVFAVGMALERNPMVALALREEQNKKDYKWEVASAGYRSVEYSSKNKMDEATEREQLERCIKIHERLLGKRPVGIYYSPGQSPSLSSRQYIVQQGGFKYDSDSFADDLPYWSIVNYENSGEESQQSPALAPSKPHLIIPYSLDCSDVQGGQSNGTATFATGAEMSAYLKDALRQCVEEGRGANGSPKVMTVGLHCRLATPGRVNGLVDFIDFAKSYSGKDVWICTREEIADYWSDEHYPKGARYNVCYCCLCLLFA
jgi:allantoinase